MYGGMSERLRDRSWKPAKRKLSGFESLFLRHLNIYASIAQSVEQGTENPCVRGSIPRRGTTKYLTQKQKYKHIERLILIMSLFYFI